MNRVLVSGLLMTTAAGLLAQLPGGGIPAPAPQPPPAGMYTWDVPERGLKSALVLSVHDGDTFTAGLLVPVVVRVDQINAPELRTPAGPASRDALAKLIGGKVLTLDMRGREKYGRVLALPWLQNTPPTNVSQWMIDNKFAVPWDGQGVKP